MLWKGTLWALAFNELWPTALSRRAEDASGIALSPTLTSAHNKSFLNKVQERALQPLATVWISSISSDPQGHRATGQIPATGPQCAVIPGATIGIRRHPRDLSCIVMLSTNLPLVLPGAYTSHVSLYTKGAILGDQEAFIRIHQPIRDKPTQPYAIESK